MPPLCTDYSSTLDCFSYILLGAPDFPGNKTSTLDSIFADIDGGIAAISSRTSNPEAITLFDECRSELHAILQLYKEGKETDAQKRIFQAKQLFVRAGKLRKGKASAERVEGDYQEDQDPPRPSTTTH